VVIGDEEGMLSGVPELPAKKKKYPQKKVESQSSQHAERTDMVCIW
jgi:hypothetical protein